MAKGDIGIGDVVAITATVRKRIDERLIISVPGYQYPISIRNLTAEAADKLHFECEVTRVDEENGRLTLRGDLSITIEAEAVQLVRKNRPEGTDPAKKR